MVDVKTKLPSTIIHFFPSAVYITADLRIFYGSSPLITKSSVAAYLSIPYLKLFYLI
ncbi:MAG: hypothetical protein NTX22_08300 [Ignavibacteriales bacterium]|nr:hypothetical protein [Ignavibacteriales bacterium]